MKIYVIQIYLHLNEPELNVGILKEEQCITANL